MIAPTSIRTIAKVVNPEPINDSTKSFISEYEAWTERNPFVFDKEYFITR